MEGYVPRLDTELDEPGMREYVDSLILSEMEVMASEGMDEAYFISRLPSLPSSLLSPVLLMELEEVARRGLRPATSHQARPLPPPPPPPSGPNPVDPSVWRRLAERAGVSLEYQTVHALNLELASRYAVDTWRSAVTDSRALAERLKKAEVDVSTEIAAVNSERSSVQEGAAVRLSSMGKRLREAQLSNTALAAAVGNGGESGRE